VPPLVLDVPRVSGALGSLRADLKGWLETRVAQRDIRDDIVLAVHEVAANSVEHAVEGDFFSVNAWFDREGLVIRVVDDGVWREPQPDPTRGRGLRIARTLSSQLRISSANGHTTTELRFAVARGNAAHPASA
jgi:anti-sigma regulatory factor (Ser/Thr protein kinase)